ERAHEAAANECWERAIVRERHSRQQRNENLELVFNRRMEYVMRMNWSKKQLVCGLSGLVLATVAWGDVNPPGDNAYHVFVERNPFGLNPPKPVPVVTNTVPVQKVDVKFSGIFTKGTRKEE